MPEKRRVVIQQRNETPSQLPSWLSEGAVIIQRLVSNGYWDKIEARFRVARPGGFVGIDIALFFILFFTSQNAGGLKKFGEKTRRFRSLLASLGSRRDFPTPSSVSRFLSNVNITSLSEWSTWLLLEASNAYEVLRHPASAAYDTHGKAWHFFDWDATRTVLRQRALPSGADLPEAHRHSTSIAQPGYTGRKRGEVVYSRAILQHAGSGLWLDLASHPCRADTAEFLPSALDAIQKTCSYGNIPHERTIIRTDGCGGNVPWISACQKANTHYITRSAHYHLFKKAYIQEALAKALWYEVNSATGPTRFAADLGELEIFPAYETLLSRPELESVKTRVVVSRFKSEDKAGAGFVHQGWQYELYATDLSPDAWPCEDIVVAYYGRAGQENRINQENRELGLERIFSYHLPGQQVAVLLGLFVWNLRITLGFELADVPQKKPQSPKSQRQVVDIPSAIVGGLEEINIPDGPKLPKTPSSSAPPPNGRRADTPNPQLAKCLDKLDWLSILRTLPEGWRRSEDGQGLICPEKAFLLPSVLQEQTKHPRLKFRAPRSSCSICPHRMTCGPGPSTEYVRTLSASIPPELIKDGLPLLLSEERERRREVHRQNSPTAMKRRLKYLRQKAKSVQASSSTKAANVSTPEPENMTFTPIISSLSGEYAVIGPRLLPAKFRHAWCASCQDIDISAVLSIPPKEEKTPCIAPSIEERQCRRQTWAYRNARNRLPADAKTEFTYIGDISVIERILGSSVMSEHT